MSFNRAQRVNQLLKKEIGIIFLKEIDFSDAFVTITKVETSGNLFEAKVFISIMPEKYSKSVFNLLNNQIYEIQQKLNKRLKTRPVPKIMFKLEQKTKSAARIEEILNKIKDD